MQENTELSLIITRRLDQYAAANDSRFLCLMSGEQYRELYRKAYGEDAEQELLREMSEVFASDFDGVILDSAEIKTEVYAEIFGMV